MKLSVIILNYNVRYYLEQCVRSVQDALRSLDAEIIVADNASTDGSGQMMSQLFPGVTFLANSENLGFSKANNLAVREAKGEYVCLLNPDTAVSQDTFVKVLSFAESAEDLGALGVRLMDGTGHYLPESKRYVPTPWRALRKLLGLGGKESYYFNKLAEFQQGEVPVLVGAFMLMRKDRYLEVGGLDEDYFMYGEDIDLSYKLNKAGYRNYYLGSVTTLHYKGESTDKDSAYLDRFYGAMSIFYKKHFSGQWLANAMVNMGIGALKSVRSRSNPVQTAHQQDDQILVLTENLPLLKKLSASYPDRVKTVSKSEVGSETYTQTLFLFDLDYIDYNQVFMLMERHKGQGNRFRIRPSGASFCLGSDRSDQKGEVLVF
ncbi:glycosyltransferase family 2 protein [Aureitalea marina]|uniref:Glycosyl transferase family 2 n=1 Tax=Aureitalea marina TaxID=930804 RepID=A0A2S7KQ92_9FLAO|nr:glycosyltransferase family 2 protein [Aureitalea marina]PQB04780.1 glycosyl transferase family 2 [Aureitalea marina]